MGLKWSKKNSGNASRESCMSPNQTQKYDNIIVNRLRDDLNDDPEMFILNNILLSIQFYEDFDREMEILRTNQISDREIELNKALADHYVHCLLPDTVMESVNQRIRFRPVHGPKKYDSQPLLPQRMFIIHDSIEVLYAGETTEYSTVDGPVHRAIVERAEKQGYVQLKQVEFLNIKGKNKSEDADLDNETVNKKTPVMITSSPATTNSPPLTPGNKRIFTKNVPVSPSALKEPQFTFTENMIPESKIPSDAKRSSLKIKIFRNQSFNLTSNRSSLPPMKIRESHSAENISKEVEPAAATEDNKEYEYTTLRRLTASKPLNEVRANFASDPTFLSSYCITEVKVKKIMESDSDDDSDDSLMENGKRRPPVKKKIEDFFEIKRYFNSTRFFALFGDVFENIHKVLGFSEESFRNAMCEGGRIHCESVDRNGKKILFEVFPSVATSWPELAFEWNRRDRVTIPDQTRNIIYKWPTDRMCAKINSLQSYVLPIGFIAKRGENENNSLEWSLSFPAAERYMQTCMSHSQVRCYLFILALYKTFMEPTNTKLGLIPHHILTIMFWQIEKNFVTWPEERLGSKMIKILNILYKHLAKGYLPDYFVRERNLLESSPSKYLRISQSKLHDIIERPVVHVLIAMRNLRYTSGSFFPPLNFKSLYKIISATDSFALINPTLADYVENNRDQGTPEKVNELKENNIKFWDKMHKKEYREKKWKHELRKQLEMDKQEKEDNKNAEQRISVDSLNLELTVSKLDLHKRRVLLEFFIKHFLKVASKSFEYGAYNYALIILEHCHSLAILLGEEPSGELEARPLKKTIMEEIDKCHRELKQAKPRVVTPNRGVKFDLSNLSDEPVPVRKKQRPENITIVTADVHESVEVSSPARSTPSVKLENDDLLNQSSDL